MVRKSFIFFGLTLLASGCFTPEPKSINSDSAPSAVPAIKDAAQEEDRHAIPKLITDLDDPDPAIRFAAITALSRMVGETFGYRYYDDADARKPAIQLWQQWLSAHPIK